MPPRVRWTFAAMTFALFLIPALALYRELSRPADIWWTPRAMMVSLTGGADRVEVYVRGRPLSALLDAGQLRVTGEGSRSVLATDDIALRFNNWDRVRAERLPILLGYAAMCGAMALLLFIFATGRLAYHGEKEAIAV